MSKNTKILWSFLFMICSPFAIALGATVGCIISGISIIVFSRMYYTN